MKERYIHFASYQCIIILSNWNVDRMWVSLFHAFNLHHEAWYHFDDEDEDKEEQQTSFCGANTRIINKAKTTMEVLHTNWEISEFFPNRKKEICNQFGFFWLISGYLDTKNILYLNSLHYSRFLLWLMIMIINQT